MDDITYPSAIPEQPEIQELKDYWYTLSQKMEPTGEQNPPLPLRSDISPLDLKKYLPDITILEITGENDFLIRLFGTNLSDWLGPDRTGRRLANITNDIKTTLDYNEAQLRWLTIMNKVMEVKKPLIWTGSRFDASRQHHQIRAISLPLTQNSGDVEQILTALYLYIPPRAS